MIINITEILRDLTDIKREIWGILGPVILAANGHLV